MAFFVDGMIDLEYTIFIMEVEKRKLIKFSNYSLCVTLPKWLITKMEWKKGDEVEVLVVEEEGKLIISRDSKNRHIKPVDELRW